MRRMVLLGALVAATVAVAGVLGTDKALAYGPGSVAQIEMSGNCNNPGYCSVALGGTGGLWIWASLNADHTSDYTFNGCGHTVGGGGGPQSGSGGGPRGVPGQGTWWTVASVWDAVGEGAFPLDIAVTSTGAPDTTVPYYVLNLGGFLAAAPMPRGHYSVPGISALAGPAPAGVSFQTQVAP